MSTTETLRKGIEAARAGRRAEARAAFRAVLREDPLNETALLWLAFLSDDPRASLSYVARALQARPRSPRARAALRWARRQMTNSPPPTSPATLPHPTPAPRNGTAGRAILGGILVLALLLLSLGVVRWTMRSQARAQREAAAVSMTSPTASPSQTPDPSPTSTTTPTPPPPTVTFIPTPTPTPTPSPSPTPTPLPTPVPTWTPRPPTPLPSASVTETRWIDVDLTHQILTAYEGSTPIRTIVVSTGLPRTPTPVGQFRIWVKLRYDDMEGPGYYLPNVPYVMYFYGPYGLHGTYWHNNFGQPMSHGCVNLPTPEAEWLFNWAEVGTLVNIHY